MPVSQNGHGYRNIFYNTNPLSIEKMHNVVIEKSSPPQDNGNITYADMVKNGTGNERVRQTRARDLYNLNGKGGNLVRSKSQSEIKRPSLVSLFMINPVC